MPKILKNSLPKNSEEVRLIPTHPDPQWEQCAGAHSTLRAEALSSRPAWGRWDPAHSPLLSKPRIRCIWESSTNLKDAEEKESAHTPGLCYTGQELGKIKQFPPNQWRLNTPKAERSLASLLPFFCCPGIFLVPTLDPRVLTCRKPLKDIRWTYRWRRNHSVWRLMLTIAQTCARISGVGSLLRFLFSYELAHTEQESNVILLCLKLCDGFQNILEHIPFSALWSKAFKSLSSQWVSCCSDPLLCILIHVFRKALMVSCVRHYLGSCNSSIFF